MKKWALIFWLVVTIILVSACGGEETTPTETLLATPEATDATQATEIPEVSLTNLLELTDVSIEEVQNINWEWAELIEVEPTGQSLVPNPESYNMVFQQDYTFTFKADCNVGGGNYSSSGTNLSLELGPITLAECGAESLHDQYMLLLAYVTSFGMNEDRLVIVTNGGKAQMVFNNGGPAEVLLEEPEVCTGISMDSWVLDTSGINYAWQPNCLPVTQYDNNQPGGPFGLPEHAQINFGVADPKDRQVGDPVIYIIPVEAYKQLWEASGDQTVTNTIDELQTLLVDKPDLLPTSDLPILPFEEVSGVNDLAVQGEYLTTKMGAGVRFVGRFSQGLNPVTSDNPQLFYIFEGFTSDGLYLISFFYPVTADSLPLSDDVSNAEKQEVESDNEAYLEAKAEELNALASSDWNPDLAILDGVINSLEFEYLIPEEEEQPVTAQLTNINWQWTEFIETEPAGQGLVPNPQNYVVIFLNDGRIDILADCNFGSGTYTQDGNSMTITIQAMTEIECERGSLSDQFVTSLGEVATYQLTIPKLTLGLSGEAGSLGLTNAGPALVPPSPGEGVPTATTTEPVNVRGGPGTAYTSYGIVPARTIFEVTGISEDGSWWVVRIPTDVSPNGQGWISANYVETENTENVPVIGAPPLDGTTPPEDGTPIAIAIEPINVRSGPGTAYLSYGVAPAGASAPVIGISADGQWWVIQLSTNIAPDGRGWVSADYVEVTNGEDVPVIEAPPLP